MSMDTRLNALERERTRRCVHCGGPLTVARPLATWREWLKAYGDLPDEEKVAGAAALNKMHLLPPALQDRAYRLYCQQQGIPDDGRSSPYSSPNPPPAPRFPENAPAPKLPPRWGPFPTSGQDSGPA